MPEQRNKEKEPNDTTGWVPGSGKDSASNKKAIYTIVGVIVFFALVVAFNS